MLKGSRGLEVLHRSVSCWGAAASKKMVLLQLEKQEMFI